MDEYLVGQPVKVFIEDIAPEGAPVQNPATIVLNVRKPDGTVDTYNAGQLTHDGTGSYSKDVQSAAGEEGTWAWRFDTTGPDLASEGVFVVKPSALLTGDAPVPITGPCHLWTDRDELERYGADLSAADEGLVERCIQAASDVMFQLGGRRWPGICDRTVRAGACNAPLLPLPEGGMVTWRVSSAWHSFGFCGGGYALELAGPIVSVAEVRLSGNVLDASAYTIRDATWLVRTDGGVWPCNGRWWEEPAPLEVDYSLGEACPPLGRLGATVLAIELLRGAPGGLTGECRLDRRVTSIVREGVSMDVAVPGLIDALAQGWTGLPEVDLFIQAHNPHRLQSRPRFVGL